MHTRDLLGVDVFDPDVYANGDPGKNGLPNEVFARLRDDAPCVRLPCDLQGHEKSAWVLSRYEDVSMMLREPDRFLSGSGVTMRATHTTVSEDGGKPAMITMDGAAHVRNRRLVNRGFTPAVVRSFEAHFRTIARDIVQRAVDLGSFDFVGEVASQFPLHAICDLLGVPDADRAALARWTNTLTTPTDPEYAPTPGEFFEAMEHMWAYGLELAELRRRNPGTDVMSVIVAAADNDTLSEDELMGFVFTLAAAGNETTRNSASHALLALLQRPGQTGLAPGEGGANPRERHRGVTAVVEPGDLHPAHCCVRSRNSGTAHRSRGTRRRIRGLRQLRRRRVRGTTRARSREAAQPASHVCHRPPPLHGGPHRSSRATCSLRGTPDGHAQHRAGGPDGIRA